ncbi:ABC transporter substrate-binding protein [Longimicrobium sp.]|uniref:ABC transporter substrate-binding protein n=1 Tax=Longimicrobium sp. TaxID=2029185 RepID=UPI002C6750E7|nr:ABC transporter substrate-binding protein [Longimicrobium sp.]HSU14674.1 ABC transporter substrate-binding protein [Longimicrobium sp.]
MPGFRWTRSATAAAIFAAAVAAQACGGGADPAAERLRRAESGRGEIVIGAAWPWAARSKLLYKQGLDMAAAEVNAKGGVLGRQIRIVSADDHESVDDGRLVAQRFAENPDVVAVIGHLQSYVTIPAAPIYDLAGVVLLAPAATDPELTQGHFSHVFRGTFSDLAAGAQLADYAHARGYRSVAIYYVRNPYGRSLANAFEEHAAELGIRIAARQSYDPNTVPGAPALGPLLDDWKQLGFDAILLAGETPHAATFLTEARRHGITAPVLGGDALGVPDLLAAGPAAEGTVIVAAFHPDAPNPQVRRFSGAFRARYGQPPDAAAALGYDAVHLLADAIGRAHSTAPDRVARALHETRGWTGVTGPFTFDASGDLPTKPITTITVRGGRFEYLGGASPASPGMVASRGRR